MSGSSLDGIDLAEVEFNETQSVSWKLLNKAHYSLDSDLCNALNNSRSLRIDQYCVLQARYSQYISACLLDFKSRFSSDSKYCSIHGHTVLHNPELPYSLQMLNPAYISSRAGMHVLHDFRNQDMALGGQGTPMAVLADRDLFPGYDFYINFGGIANVSFRHNNSWTAYDLCPCNQVHNYFSGKLGFDFDRDGTLGKQGSANEEIIDALMRSDYIKSMPPKSIDNQWIKESWIPLLEKSGAGEHDILATHYRFIARIISNLVSGKESKILCTGGGAKNTYLISLINALLPDNTDLVVPDEEILDYKESILMAYMAYCRINYKCNFIPEASGASRAVCAGSLYYNNAID